MNVIVCVKQIPDPADPGALDPTTKTLKRDGKLILVTAISPTPAGEGPRHLVPDNWIYVQEPGVQVGRLQVFNNCLTKS